MRRFPWLCLLLILTGCHFADKPTISVDLRSYGLPQDFFAEGNRLNCSDVYYGYRSVQWIDKEKLLVGFNTQSGCATHGGYITGNLRLLVMKKDGSLIHSTDIAYDPGYPNFLPALENDGISLGPEDSILVETPSTHMIDHEVRSQLLVYSSDLKLLQTIDTDRHATAYDALNFDHVSADRKQVFFWTSEGGQHTPMHCFMYSGLPLKFTAQCDASQVLVSPFYEKLIFKQYGWTRAFAGENDDGSRIALFAEKDNALCEFSHLFCIDHGTLFTFIPGTSNILWTQRFPNNGRAAMSSDGKLMAELRNNALQVYALP